MAPGLFSFVDIPLANFMNYNDKMTPRPLMLQFIFDFQHSRDDFQTWRRSHIYKLMILITGLSPRKGLFNV